MADRKTLKMLKDSLDDALARYEFSDYKAVIDKDADFEKKISAVLKANIELFFCISLLSQKAERVEFKAQQEG